MVEREEGEEGERMKECMVALVTQHRTIHTGCILSRNGGPLRVQGQHETRHKQKEPAEQVIVTMATTPYTNLHLLLARTDILLTEVRPVVVRHAWHSRPSLGV